MNIVKFCLMTSLAFGLPFAATAQQDVAKAAPSDIQYCHALSHAYSYMWSNNEGMPVAEAFVLDHMYEYAWLSAWQYWMSEGAPLATSCWAVAAKGRPNARLVTKQNFTMFMAFHS